MHTEFHLQSVLYHFALSPCQAFRVDKARLQEWGSLSAQRTMLGIGAGEANVQQHDGGVDGEVHLLPFLRHVRVGAGRPRQLRARRTPALCAAPPGEPRFWGLADCRPVELHRSILKGRKRSVSRLNQLQVLKQARTPWVFAKARTHASVCGPSGTAIPPARRAQTAHSPCRSSRRCLALRAQARTEVVSGGARGDLRRQMAGRYIDENRGGTHTCRFIAAAAASVDASTVRRSMEKPSTGC